MKRAKPTWCAKRAPCRSSSGRVGLDFAILARKPFREAIMGMMDEGLGCAIGHWRDAMATHRWNTAMSHLRTAVSDTAYGVLRAVVGRCGELRPWDALGCTPTKFLKDTVAALRAACATMRKRAKKDMLRSCDAGFRDLLHAACAQSDFDTFVSNPSHRTRLELVLNPSETLEPVWNLFRMSPMCFTRPYRFKFLCNLLPDTVTNGST